MTEIHQQREQRLRRACAELRAALRAREGSRAEAILARYPELAGDADSALEFVYTGWVTREELGEQPTVEELIQRFPQWQVRLKRLLEVHAGMLAEQSRLPSADTLAARTPQSALPEKPLRRLGSYEVLEQIGQGGMGV